ncbi:MAG: type II secretion system protein [Phycisphaerales bacterium]|nr:type II secretion system protein [Phycisphaerales bacterium]
MRVAQTRRRPAFLLVELIVGTAILGLLMLAVSRLVSDYQSAVRSQLLRARLNNVAQARLEEIRAGVIPLENAVRSEDDDTSVEIVVRDAEGDWAPLKFVEVTASAPLRHDRVLRAAVRAYVASPQATREAQP